ncbi:MAG: glycine--tRNA ligase subunit beta [Acidiferrobacterales bacterium]
MAERTGRGPKRARPRPTHSKPKTAADLLLELGTEELPPKSLKALSAALGEHLYQGLSEAGLITADSAGYRVYATARRLAVCVPQVLRRQPDQIAERRGPSLQSAFDSNGQATAAAIGFARSCGVAVGKLERLETEKGAWLVFRHRQPGIAASKLVPGIVNDALKRLPVYKRMRWADLDAEFVRPVHWVVLLHGTAVVRCQVLSVRAGRNTFGHRFHCPRPLNLASTNAYPTVLERRGHVIASFEARKALIRSQASALARRTQGTVVIDEPLLDEITALVEWPQPMLGSFDEAFLKLPPEPLISTMRDHQKCLHVVNSKGALLPYFITVSNIKSKHVNTVRQGNERVIRARFADAEFFWDTDRKTRLRDRVDELKGVVFHDKLGSLYDKMLRTDVLAVAVANAIDGDVQRTKRAALLAKVDLLTGMVGEFPELQGVMGRYYAQHDGEEAEVADAIEEHYLPRYAGDRLARTHAGQALAIADRLDTLVGIFAVGETPTGDRDPFGLRRAAMGVLRTAIERELELDLRDLLQRASENYPGELRKAELVSQVYDFMMDRLRAYYQEAGISTDVYEAVLACRPRRPSDFDRRVRAVMAFRALPEAESLTTANKRIRNILRQGGNADWGRVSPTLLQEEAETRLAAQVDSLDKSLAPLFATGEYTEAMKQLAALRPQVDEFFDKVLVMVDEEAVRDNRLALLSSLSTLFLCVADLSKLQS